MTPKNSQSAPQDVSGSTDLSGNSYASIQKPELASGDQHQYILLWGRFWGEIENLAVAFAVKLNLEKILFVNEEFLIYEDAARIEQYDPDQPFARFKDTIKQRDSDPMLADATIKQVSQSFKNYLRNQENEEVIFNALKEKEREAFADQAYDIVNNILHKGEFTYQFKGGLTHSDTPDASKTDTSDQDQSSSDDDKEDYINVKPVTSPMNGIFPTDLTVGEEVFVRTTGSVTKNLPDHLRDDNHDNLSIPLEASVRSISPDVDLPPNFDGDSENYWNLTVNLMNDYLGQTYIHKDSQVKSAGSGSPADDGSFFTSPVFLIAMGLSLMTILGLAYVLFGV